MMLQSEYVSDLGLNTLLIKKKKNVSKLPYYLCKITQKGSKSVLGILCIMNFQGLHSYIIPHEHVCENKVNDYVSQFLFGKKLNNPILLFYKRYPDLKRYIHSVISISKPLIDYECSGVQYEIFPIANGFLEKKIKEFIGLISMFYIADGHHRVYALSKLFMSSQTILPLNFISLLIEDDDLFLGSFNRFVSGVAINDGSYIKELEERYSIVQVDESILDLKKNTYIYLDCRWYHLQLKTQFLESFIHIDSVHVEKYVISPLKKKFSKTIKIQYSPGTNITDRVISDFQKNNSQIAIHVPKIELGDLYAMLEKRFILPPHSTCFTPKIPNNLVVQQLDF